MIIETIFGIALSLSGGGDAGATDPASMIYKGIITSQKIIENQDRFLRKINRNLIKNQH